MRLSRALKEKLLDVRLRDKLIAEGKISKTFLDQAYAELPDDFDNLMYTDHSAVSREDLELPKKSSGAIE